MKRRDFLKTAAAAGIGLGVFSQLPGSRLHAAESDAAAGTPPDLVAVMGGEPVEMFRAAIAEFGGIGTFVRPGQLVVVKPNIGWDQPPEMGADTNPELVGEIVRQCVAAGAREVAVFDHTCNEWRACYRNSGIEDAVKAAGGVVYMAHREEDYVPAEIPGGKNLRQALVHHLIPACDVLINVPVLKHHGGASMTCAMKNFMGVVWDRRFMHQNDLQQCIADSVLLRKPDLNVVDAYRVMVRNGPRGVSSQDIVTPKVLMMGRDIVAVDTAAARQAGFDIDAIGHLAKAEALGLGTTNLAGLNIKRTRMNG